MYSYVYYYRMAPFLRATNFMMGVKKIVRGNIRTNHIGGMCCHSLQYASAYLAVQHPDVALPSVRQVIKTFLCATLLATPQGIMANKLAEERFNNERISYLQRIKRLLCLQFTCCVILLSISISSWYINWSGYVRLEIG